ncbi:MAG TPA: hypothetical protein VGS19_23565 [Streptosporangiaceae bacterium]|nr:hypothetical protein [Streptosporangiaceae bacterium]
MRAIHINPGPRSGHPAPKPGTPSPKRPPGTARPRTGARTGAGSWLRGLRWVPVPLAALAAMIGTLVLGSLQGQVAAANARHPSYQAGGLALSVDTMLWMSNDMTGQGPAQTNNHGFAMASSMMPGMQAPGQDRLRVEVNLSNVTADLQRYSITDFSVAGPSGRTWKVDGYGHSDSASSANLEPGFGVTIDVYFDVPAKQSKHLTLQWSRGGTTVSIPVNTVGAQPGPMHM